MILVKSLIVIFLLLFFFRYFDRFVTYMSNKFDGREGFASEADTSAYGAADTSAYGAADTSAADTSAADTSEVAEDDEEEISYNVGGGNQTLMAEDAKLMGDLQDKMKELLQLSDKATVINNDIKKIK
jgi:hypothetical protein